MAKRIGELLIEAQIITPAQLDQALAAQRADGRKLGQILIELSLATETQLTQALSRQLAVPWVSLYHISFSRGLLNYVPQAVAEKYCLVPIFVRKTRKEGETLYVAMDDPTNDGAIAAVAKAAGVPVKPMIACPGDIRSAIRVHYQGFVDAPPPTVPATEVSLADARSAASPRSGQHQAARAEAQKPAPPAPPEEDRATMPAAEAPPPSAARPTAVPDSEPPTPRLHADALPAPAPPPADGRSAASPRPGRHQEPELEAEPVEEVEPEPAHAEDEAPPAPPPSEDTPDAGPEIEAVGAVEFVPRARRPRPKMLSLTLLDGTTIQVPASKGKNPSRPDVAPKVEGVEEGYTLTTRDLISALRAVAHGADASEILGDRPPKWEAMMATLLALLLKKGIIADWEFVEEFRKA